MVELYRTHVKGTDFNEVSDKEIAKIEHTLNTRRRASLNYRSPNHGFFRVFDGGLV